jgi:ABC-type antimicrobial peptide transport system ATPase subunit
MVLYCYDANAILTEPLKNRTEAELSRAYKKMYEYLKAKGLNPKHTGWIMKHRQR